MKNPPRPGDSIRTEMGTLMRMQAAYDIAQARNREIQLRTRPN